MSTIVRTLSLALLSLFMLAGLAGGAKAAPCTVCICSVAVTTPVTFASYSPVSLVDDDTSGVVNFSCLAVSVNTSITIDVKISQGSAASYTPRKMTKGANAISYNLFTDSGRTTIWGDGTGGSGYLSDSGTVVVIVGFSKNYTIYGRIPAGQNISAGIYNDSVTVTFSF